jgi:hypothetical protein
MARGGQDRHLPAGQRLQLAMQRAEKMAGRYEVAISNQKEIIERQKNRILELEAEVKALKAENGPAF